MELSHSLLLNEQACSQLSEQKRPIFVFEWLRFLDKILAVAHKTDIKESQKQLVEQLLNQIHKSPGPPTRRLLARCLSTLFSVGDTFDLMPTINICNDIIKNKDDSPSYLPTKLAAVAITGAMYERLGRMVGRSYEETVSLLLKAMKNAESQGRCEILLTFQKVISGLGFIGVSSYKDIYKVSKNCLTDRSMFVRCAAANCLYELVNHCPQVIIMDIENVSATCFRAFDGSNYDVRCAVAKLLGHLLSSAISTPIVGAKQKNKQITHEESLSILSNGFLKGGFGFLKGTAGELMKGGGASLNREVRVGVTHAYVEFVRAMGGLWLERNMKEFLEHVLGLLGSPKTTSTHVDAVYARKCVLFILRSSIGALLAEKSQTLAAREICKIIIQHMNVSSDVIFDAVESRSHSSSSSEFSSGQQVIVCALHELSCIVQNLGTSSGRLIADTDYGIIEPVVSALIHPGSSVRLSAAWCLRSIAVALPSVMTPLIERSMKQMQHLKSSPEAVSGYSCALAALLAGVQNCSLGIPYAKGKAIFQLAEELHRTATQNSRLSFQRTQSGWLLLGAMMTLGPSAIRPYLPKLLLLWRNAFPRSTKELESEKNRGDPFTWQVTLESRSGALAAMQSFIAHCGELITEDVIRRLMPPIERALAMLTTLNHVIKLHGGQLKAGSAMVRLRLYDVLLLLPPETYEGAYNALLRELVAEFTLTDNPANTSTSLLRSMCHVDDSVILGSWLQETDHKFVEDQLQPNSASGSGAIEHDLASLFLKQYQSDTIPGPLPLGVAVINSSVRLYGAVFPRVPYKHRVQMLDHFAECIKQAKSARQQAVQINIFTAVLCALKSLAESKLGFGQHDVQKSAVNLVLGAVISSNPILRCAAGEALGRMSQVVGDHKFIAEMAQYSFDKLKSARDVITRTGHSLALGCLHRYVGGMGSGHHLSTSVGVLLALANDQTSPVVQVWALHALGLIADSGGPMFRGYVEPTLSLILSLLLNVSISHVDVYQCLGKCLAALITTIGPELQGNSNSAATARLSCLICCAIMQDHHDSLVRAEAISCLQQMHMFAPRHVNLSSLVPHLCRTLESSHLILRRASVSCLRQLSQREAAEVSQIALEEVAKDTNGTGSLVTESGLEAALFRLLDKETDTQLCSQVRDTISSLLQSLGATDLKRWLGLLREILTAADPSSETSESGEPVSKDDEANDDESFTTADVEVSHPQVAPRWPTKVFAMECLQRLHQVCECDQVHFDLCHALKQRKADETKDFLILHLSELVRMAFIAATSDSDKLRLSGLAMLEDIIRRFAAVPEPEFPGHVILEQYQAQVSAALRPAFSKETPPDITAEACVVCSSWIGSGVARDLNDLRRVHQLLVTSLAKLDKTEEQNQLYSESASTMEKLALLKAWAEVYTVAMRQEKETQDSDENRESLLFLVQPQLELLGKHWLDALQDHALLSLPPEFLSQLPPNGGSFYSSECIDSARPYYRNSWAPISLACAQWLSESGFTTLPKSVGEVPANMAPDHVIYYKFHLLFGVCVNALCAPVSTLSNENLCLILKTLEAIFTSEWPRSKLVSRPEMAVEFINILHRCLLTRDLIEIHLMVMSVLKKIVLGAHDHLKSKRVDMKTKGSESEESEKEVLGEGGENGELDSMKSVVFSVLEVLFCACIKHSWLDHILKIKVPESLYDSKSSSLTKENSDLVAMLSDILVILPELCSPNGALYILPTCLQLVVGILKHVLAGDANAVGHECIVASLRSLCSISVFTEPVQKSRWLQLLHSTFSTIASYDGPSVNKVAMMRALAVSVTACPTEVALADKIKTQFIDSLTEVWQTNEPAAQRAFLLTTDSILQLEEKRVMISYIKVISPTIITHLGALTSKSPKSRPEVEVACECIKVMNSIVDLAAANTRISLVAVHVPILVRLLLKPEMIDEASDVALALHEFALSNLLSLGLKYSSEFKTVISYSNLHAQLRSAIEASEQRRKTTPVKQQARGAGAKPAPVPAEPTIKLKTDFSNFDKK